MKGFCARAFCIGILCCLSSYLFASQLIYGLDNASRFQHHIQSSVSIQVASFVSESRALNYQKRIKPLTHYPVNVVYKNNYHAVIVGPFKSLPNLHEAAHELLQSMNEKNSKPIKLKSTASEETIANPKMMASWFVSGGGGWQFPKSNSNMTVENGSGFPAPSNMDTYSLNKHSSRGLILLSAGRRWIRDSAWFPSYWLGLSYQHFAGKKINGTVIEYSLPEFTNYIYQWKLSSNILLAQAKINIYQLNKFSPYFSAGLGNVFNRTYGYKETALPGVTPRISPSFANLSNNHLAYHLGLGLDYQPSNNILLSLGYQYQYLGDIHSGHGTGTWSNAALSLGDMASNQVVASMSYLFNL